MSNIKLHHYFMSAPCHRVELLASLLKLNVELVTVDLTKGAQKEEAFLGLNPAGLVPVLVDGGVVLPESNSILVYLAQRYDDDHTWLPQNEVGAAEVQRFLSIASGPLRLGPYNARAITVFGADFDVSKTLDASHAILTLLDKHLEGRTWLVGNAPTIADVANYADIVLAPEGNVSLNAYANIRAWLQSIEALPGFVPMTATAAGLAA